MPAGVTAAVVAAAAVVLTGGGYLAGRASGRRDVEAVTDAVEAQTEQLATVGDALVEVQAAASRPVVIDAEIRDTLAQVPPQCRGDADVSGLACAWATCIQYGQSSANRPECGPIRDAYLASVACPDRQPSAE
jgi:hypothetical protein